MSKQDEYNETQFHKKIENYFFYARKIHADVFSSINRPLNHFYRMISLKNGICA